jgi:hypothetical protein
MTFDEWFEKNKKLLARLLHSDPADFAYECWLAGYESGLAEMGKFTVDLLTDTQ